jgi:hypothetical protein
VPHANAGPLPTQPPKVTIPNITTTSKTSGTIDVPASQGFFYAGIQSLWIWWSVELDVLRAYLEPYGVTPYDFGGTGAVNINFFNAAALYGSGQPGNPGISGFNETEVNIAGYATKVGVNVPQGLTLQSYLTLGEQTKRVGNYRMWVACDDAIAVAFGRQLFYENKFLVSYKYTAPSPNLPGVTGWDWTCYDSEQGTASIYTASADLAGLTGIASNMSEWIDISFDESSRRPVASRRNYFGMYQTYQVPSTGSQVSLSYGDSKHPMRHDMERLIGTRRPSYIQHFASPTCIAEATPYYADL